MDLLSTYLAVPLRVKARQHSMQTEELIHIALAFDTNYLNQVYALATSIFHTNPGRKITIHAIIAQLEASVTAEIRAYVGQHGASICFYEAPAGFGANFRLDGNWTVAAYYRLLFPHLLPKEVDKYIYIDTDTLVVGDLTQLWHTDVKDYVVAAVRDRLIPTRLDLGITTPGNYFNSGVLVVNKRLWIENHITEQSINFINDHPEKIFFADQDALNFLLHEQWQKLDLCYNLMFADIPEDLPRREFETFLRDKVVLHFTQHRPWNRLCENRFRYLYHHYLQVSDKRTGPRYHNLPLSQDNLIRIAKIKIRELYFDHPRVMKAWRAIKSRLKGLDSERPTE